MKTTENQSIQKLITFGLGIAMGGIGGWLLATLKKDKKEKYQSISSTDSITSEDSQTADNISNSPIFLYPITPNSIRFLENKLLPGSKLTIEDILTEKFTDKQFRSPGDRFMLLNAIKNAVVPYVHRVRKAAIKCVGCPPSINNYIANLNTEKLLVYMEKEDIMDLFAATDAASGDPTKCKGLIGVFAIDTDTQGNQHQTIVLVPYNKDYKVMPIENPAGTAAAYAGYQRWQERSLAKPMRDIVAASDPVIKERIDLQLHNNLGIPRHP